MDITVTLEDGEELTDGEIIVNDARGVVVRTSTPTRHAEVTTIFVVLQARYDPNHRLIAIGIRRDGGIVEPTNGVLEVISR
jgi:hypothetical protein